MNNKWRFILRLSFPIYLSFFQIAFIVLTAVFADYAFVKGSEQVPNYYAMWQDVHTMMFVGFGFLMTFLRKYGYGSLGFNFMLAAYVMEWSLLVRGWFEEGIENYGKFVIDIKSLLVADFCAAAVLISFGAVLGKASPTQLLIMGTIEVVIQTINEWLGVHYLKAYDVGESMYVHIFGAYFGLTVAKILNHGKVESEKESATPLSDLFSMIGTVFLWLFWPSFNSATAVDEGQMRAIVNTLLSITSSCICTFIISTFVGKGKLNMVHIQNATLAGGVAVGTVADMNIRPFGAMLIGSVAGVISTLGFQYLTPLLKKIYLHDTCGVNNLHGMPGLLSGICGGIVAAAATREDYNGNDLYKFYPARTPVVNSTDYFKYGLNATTEYVKGGLGRSAVIQGSYQIAGLALTLGLAIVSGIVTGLIMKIPVIENIKEAEKMFEDEEYWEVPEEPSKEKVRDTHI